MYKEKAEKYVREQLPELMELSFGCEVIVRGIREDNPGHERDVVIDDRKDEHSRIGLGYYGHVHPDDFEQIIGHPIQLQHWLSAIRNNGLIYCEWFGDEALAVQDCNDGGTDKTVYFNLTTGQPATEADYQAFCEIVGIA